MITWHAVHTLPSKEVLATQNLLQQGVQVYLPQILKQTRHARKIQEKQVALFPRYLFVGMDLSVTQWRTINHTRGVAYLLMNHQQMPALVPEKIISDLKAQEDDQGIVTLASLNLFSLGDKVRILEGSFKDHLAIVDGLDDKQRVQVLLNFMGREARIAMPAYAIVRE